MSSDMKKMKKEKEKRKRSLESKKISDIRYYWVL